jgi:hypothetical protein
MVKFWKIAPYDKQFNNLVILIQGNKQYPLVKFTKGEIIDILEKYIPTAYALSVAKNANVYYNGMTDSELDESKTRMNNIFIKTIYMSFKSIITENALVEQIDKGEFDYILRDKIWVVVSLLKSFGMTYNGLKKFWQPFWLLGSNGIIKEDVMPEKDTDDGINSKQSNAADYNEPVRENKGLFYAAIAGIGLFFFMSKKNKKHKRG